MLVVVALALLGSALALPQFNQFAQKPLPLPQFAPAPAPIAQQATRSPITILQRTELSDDNGNFETKVTQSDGTQFFESGSLEPTNDKLDKVAVKKGSYSYTSPEGVPIHVEYTADRYGFHPKGTIIPI